MLTGGQAEQLKAAGLDYYNHNLDTSPEYYGAIITTRTYQDRLDTLGHVRDAGIHVCCGGIVGMGEGREDRVGMIATLANLPAHPESVPINMLVEVEGTPLARGAKLDPLEFVRTIAVAPHHHAEIGGAALGRARGHERRDPGAVLPRRRQLDLLRPEAAHHAQSRRATATCGCSTSSAWRRCASIARDPTLRLHDGSVEVDATTETEDPPMDIGAISAGPNRPTTSTSSSKSRSAARR